MAASTRIRGNALKLTVGGTDYFADCISVVLQNEDSPSNVLTFADAAAGGAAKQFYFTIEAIQSTDAASFWMKIWNETTNGSAPAEIAYVYNPWGATSPTTAKPNFTGKVKMLTPPDLGGTASTTDDYTFTIRLDCVEVPTKVTA